MKFTLIYIIALVILSVNGVLSKPRRKKSPVKTDDFCDGKTGSDGTQNPDGSCSTFIQGDIPSSDNMPSTLIVHPENGGTVSPNKAFTVDIVLANIETGKFSDPETQYNNIPQSLNSNGLILGHTHVTIQELKSSSTPPDSKKFAFFKGVNDKADRQGRISVDVVDENGKKGLPSGHYRICTMTSSFSHQPVIMPVAKRGSQDDCIRIRVS